MSVPTHDFPDPHKLPIPEDVQPGPGWTEQMVEMAAHIGPYLTLLIVDRFGGQMIYVTADPEKNPFRELIGAEAATIISHVYRRERLQIPTARFALRRARREGILAAVRANRMTAGEAARILKMSRSYMANLINATDEGTGVELSDWTPTPSRRLKAPDPRQIALFPEADE